MINIKRSTVVAHVSSHPLEDDARRFFFFIFWRRRRAGRLSCGWPRRARDWAVFDWPVPWTDRQLPAWCRRSLRLRTRSSGAGGGGSGGGGGGGGPGGGGPSGGGDGPGDDRPRDADPSPSWWGCGWARSAWNRFTSKPCWFQLKD